MDIAVVVSERTVRNMTTSEAIKWFENRKSGSTMPGARMVFDMALEALREKAAREEFAALKEKETGTDVHQQDD